jgi:hypothetical protein
MGELQTIGASLYGADETRVGVKISPVIFRMVSFRGSFHEALSIP